MPKPNLRAAVIGLGVGAQHLEIYHVRPDVEVAGICDLSQKVLEQFKMRFPRAKATLDANDLIDDPTISLLSICSYDDAHYEQIMRALENEKHIFVEKPLCLTPSHARDIRKLLLKKPHLMMSSNLIMRKYPRFLELRSLLEQGKLGSPYYLEGDYNYGRLEKILTGWRGRIPDYSPLLGGGIHIVDLMLSLLGKLPTEVFAYSNKIVTAGSTYQNYDLISGLLRFDAGVVAKVTVNLGCVYPHFHRFQVYGTKGTFENDFEFAKLFNERDPDRNFKKIEVPYPGVTKGGLLEDFLDALAKGCPPPVSEKEIFECLSVCFAIEKSAATNSPQRVEYL